MFYFNELRQIGCCSKSLENIIEWFLERGVYGIIDKYWDENTQEYNGYEITIYIDKKGVDTAVIYVQNNYLDYKEAKKDFIYFLIEEYRNNFL